MLSKITESSLIGGSFFDEVCLVDEHDENANAIRQSTDKKMFLFIMNWFCCKNTNFIELLSHSQNPTSHLFRMVHKQLSVIHFWEDLHVGIRA